MVIRPRRTQAIKSLRVRGHFMLISLEILVSYLHALRVPTLHFPTMPFLQVPFLFLILRQGTSTLVPVIAISRLVLQGDLLMVLFNFRALLIIRLMLPQMRADFSPVLFKTSVLYRIS